MWEFNWGVFWAVLAVAGIVGVVEILFGLINVLTGDEVPPEVVLQPIMKKLDMIADRLEAMDRVAQRQEDAHRAATRSLDGVP